MAIRRVAKYAYSRLGAEVAELALFTDDIADSTQLELPLPAVPVPRSSQQLTIGWVTTPPSLGSGGHTTMFRMVQALEEAGHRCVLFLYDRYAGQVSEQEKVIRQGWPQIKAAVRDATETISGVDAAIATSWESAHVLAKRGTAPMRRLYFVQDYEPYFYGRGSVYALAEDSYRFGFRTIALGHMVGKLLTTEIGISPDVTEFGCDGSVYRLVDGAQRSGVVFYARPEVPRRGYWLARLALEEFHRRHPNEPIHVYGSPTADLPFPVIAHRRLSPVQLNELYNSVVAGLAMSFTNISLVAEEMLSAGAIPVVNDSDYSRADIENDFITWASPTPGGIADALSAAVSHPDPRGRASLAAGSVQRTDWSVAQGDVVRIVEEEVYGPWT